MIYMCEYITTVRSIYIYIFMYSIVLYIAMARLL